MGADRPAIRTGPATAGGAPRAPEGKSEEKHGDQPYMSLAEFQASATQADIGTRYQRIYYQELYDLHRAVVSLHTHFPSTDDQTERAKERKKETDDFLSLKDTELVTVKRKALIKGITTIANIENEGLSVPLSDEIAFERACLLVNTIRRDTKKDAALPDSIFFILIGKARYLELSHNEKRNLYSDAKRILDILFEIPGYIGSLDLHIEALEKIRKTYSAKEREIITNAYLMVAKIDKATEFFHFADDPDLEDDLVDDSVPDNAGQVAYGEKRKRETIESTIGECLKCRLACEKINAAQCMDLLNALYKHITHLEHFHHFHAQIDAILAEDNKREINKDQKEQLKQFDIKVLLPVYHKKVENLEEAVLELQKFNKIAANKNKLDDILDEIKKIKKATSSRDAKKALNNVYAMLRDKKYLRFGMQYIIQHPDGGLLIVADAAKERINLLKKIENYLLEIAKLKGKDPAREKLKSDFQQEMRLLLNGEYTAANIIELAIPRVQNICDRYQNHVMPLDKSAPVKQKVDLQHYTSELTLAKQGNKKEKEIDFKYDPDKVYDVALQFCSGHFTKKERESGEVVRCLGILQASANPKLIDTYIDLLLKALNQLTNITTPQKEAINAFYENQLFLPAAHNKAKKLEAVIDEWLELHQFADSKETDRLSKLLKDVQTIEKKSSRDANNALETARKKLQEMPLLEIAAPIRQNANGDLTLIVRHSAAGERIFLLRSAKNYIEQAEKYPELKVMSDLLKAEMKMSLREKSTEGDKLKLKKTCDTVGFYLAYLKEAEKVEKVLNELLKIYETAEYKPNKAADENPIEILKKMLEKIEKNKTNLILSTLTDEELDKLKKFLSSPDEWLPNAAGREFIHALSTGQTEKNIVSLLRSAMRCLEQLPKDNKADRVIISSEMLFVLQGMNSHRSSLESAITRATPRAAAKSATYGAGQFDHGKAAAARAAADAARALTPPAAGATSAPEAKAMCPRNY